MKLYALARTGMPLGIEEDSSWERRTINFNPGDKLILYTDGVTEAQNEDGDIFDEQLLIECILRQPESSAFVTPGRHHGGHKNLRRQRSPI